MFRQVFVCLLLWMFHYPTTLALTSSLCAEVPNGKYVRSSESCSSYNQCVNGQPIHGVCPRGFSFNAANQMCDFNINVNCRLCSPFGIQNIPEPDSCLMYYRCVNGRRTSMVCSNGLMFDRKFGDCNISERVICETKNLICVPFSWMGTITIGNPLDCSSYYICINGNAIEAMCPSGLFFNPHTATCEPRGIINFCQDPVGPLITTPLPEIITMEYTTTQPTAKTTMRVIYITSSAPPTQS